MFWKIDTVQFQKKKLISEEWSDLKDLTDQSKGWSDLNDQVDQCESTPII